MVANETNEKLDDIMWTMPCLMTFKCLALAYTMKTGKAPMTHKEREVIKRQQQAFKELQSV